MRVRESYYLDYQINKVLNNYRANDGSYCYDFVRWEVWFKNPELLKEINDTFKLSINLEEFTRVDNDLANNIWKFVNKRKKLIGTYGTKYLNSVI